jgi:hypothetical protein
VKGEKYKEEVVGNDEGNSPIVSHGRTGQYHMLL